LLFVFSIRLFGQPPPPPPPEPSPIEKYIGGTSIAEGVIVLLSLSLAYGLRVLYNNKKRKLIE